MEDRKPHVWAASVREQPGWSPERMLAFLFREGYPQDECQCAACCYARDLEPIVQQRAAESQLSHGERFEPPCEACVNADPPGPLPCWCKLAGLLEHPAERAGIPTLDELRAMSEADDVADARKAIEEHLTGGPVPPNVARAALGLEPLPANPKDQQALRDGKPPLDLIEYAMEVEVAKVMLHGARKYGRRNYVHPDTPILATTYGAAVRRHIGAWLDGEDNDPDSGLSHWAHIGANVNVVLGAMAAGTFVDDRGAVGTTEQSAVSNARHSGS